MKKIGTDRETGKTNRRDSLLSKNFLSRAACVRVRQRTKGQMKSENIY